MWLLVETKLNTIAARIPRFDGQTVELFGAWKTAMEIYVPELTQAELFALTRRTLTGPALRALLEHATQANGQYRTYRWDELLTFFRDTHLLQNAQYSVRHDLQSFRFHPAEYPFVFRDRLLECAKLAYTDEQLAQRQPDLIAAYVNALSDRSLQIDLLRKNFTNLTDLVREHANLYFAERSLSFTESTTGLPSNSTPPKQVHFAPTQADTLQNCLEDLTTQISKLNINMMQSHPTYDDLPAQRVPHYSDRSEMFHGPPRRAPTNDYPPVYRQRSPSPYYERDEWRQDRPPYHHNRQPNIVRGTISLQFLL